MKTIVAFCMLTMFTSNYPLSALPKPVKKTAAGILNPSNIKKEMQKTADWQFLHPLNYNRLDWEYGVFYAGVWALYQTTGQEKYKDSIQQVGEKNHWKLMNDIYHADRLAIAQSFADLYLKTKDPAMLEKIQWVMDMYVDRTAKANVHFQNNPYRFEWWTWCDALFMAPPAFARVYAATGDIKYLNYMDQHWWLTSDYLYDTVEHLFYRDDRFFDQRAENGKKVFWSRGNGWVMGGLVRVLEYMPQNYPTRSRYITQFRQMADKIAMLQGADGLWRSSLLDPGQYPIGETSGSALFCYALAWGINNGILSKARFTPIVEKAWKGLAHDVDNQGMLGYVQQIGDSPKAISKNDFQVYGTGAFLLAGSEMVKLEAKEK